MSLYMVYVLKEWRAAVAVAIAATAAAVVLPHGSIVVAGHDIDSRVLLLVLAMVLWGVAEGGGPVIESIFADSVPTGEGSPLPAMDIWSHPITARLISTSGHSQVMSTDVACMIEIENQQHLLSCWHGQSLAATVSMHSDCHPSLL